MGMGSRGGGGDVFGCGHLAGRISPFSFVKMDREGITFGQAGQLRGFAGP